MTDKIKKIKDLHLSEHQKRNLKRNRPGHDYDLEDAEELLETYEESWEQPEDGRVVGEGWLRGNWTRVVVSCTPFFTTMAGVVTMHRRKPPKTVKKKFMLDGEDETQN